MMHFSTSDENFRKKLSYGCKVRVPKLEAVGIFKIRPLTSDLIEKKTDVFFSQFHKYHDSLKAQGEIFTNNKYCDLT